MEINYERVVTLTLCVVACIVLVGSTGSNVWVKVIDRMHDDVVAATYGMWKVCIWQKMRYDVMSCQYWHEINDSDKNIWKFRKDNADWIDVVCAVSALACIFSVISVVLCVWSLVRPTIKKLDIFILVSLAMTVIFMSASVAYFAAKYTGTFPRYVENLSWAYAAGVSGMALTAVAVFIELASLVRKNVKNR